MDLTGTRQEVPYSFPSWVRLKYQWSPRRTGTEASVSAVWARTSPTIASARGRVAEVTESAQAFSASRSAITSGSSASRSQSHGSSKRWPCMSRTRKP